MRENTATSLQKLPYLALLAGVVGCGETNPIATAPQPPNAPASADALPDLVLIALDGVRADVRPAEDQTAILLKAFPEAPLVQFDSAFATSASASTSFGSMLTGRYPAAIPLCRVREGAAVSGVARPWCSLLPDTRASLPDIVAAYGYDTAFFSTEDVGFDTFANRFQTAARVDLPAGKDLPVLAGAAGEWWAAHADHPRLLVIHLNTLANAVDISHLRATDMPPISPESARASLVASGSEGPAPDMVAFGAKMREHYSAALHEMVAPLAEAVRRLTPAAGRPTWTILTSLFGANLGETTGFKSWRIGIDNRQYLLERTLHVPLVVWGPKQETSDSHGLVELTDIVPTLLSRVGAVFPAGAHGRDLLSAAADTTPWAYAEFGDMLSVRQDALRLTLRTYVHDSSSLDPTLTESAKALTLDRNWTVHDVVSDPLQAHNLAIGNAEPHRDAVTTLHRTMLTVREGPGAPPPDQITPEKLWALRMSAGQGYW